MHCHFNCWQIVVIVVGKGQRMGHFSNKGLLPTLRTKSGPQFWECPIFEGGVNTWYNLHKKTIMATKGGLHLNLVSLCYEIGAHMNDLILNSNIF
jgi:hypothetical protein